jgi:hypothetical protein
LTIESVLGAFTGSFAICQAGFTCCGTKGSTLAMPSEVIMMLPKTSAAVRKAELLIH